MATADHGRQRWIFGAGYLGLRVARRWQAQGVVVHIATRSPSKAAALQAEGFIAHLIEWNRSSIDWPASLDAVLWAVGFDRAIGETIELVQVERLERVLESLATSGVMPRVWVQISTTGVYGDCAGDWVNEQTECHPDRDSGIAAYTAEQRVAESASLRASVALRLAGIYGPGRVPNVGAMRNQEPIAADPTGWLNLIHVDDAVNAVDLVCEQPLGSRHSTFVLSDGHPTIRRDYYRWVAQKYGLPDPIFEPPGFGSSKAARGVGSKRIDSTAFWKTFQSSPQFPSYIEGLSHSLDS